MKLKLGYQALIAQAMAQIETLPLEQAKKLLSDKNVIFVDIRDVRELEREGMIPDALHAPRGMLEFWVDPESPYYKIAEEIAAKLVRHGYGVITGGGPGIMEAANRGAFEAGDQTIGFNISLPREQHPNPYISPGLSFRFHYFALRKMHFMLRARAIVVFPGGFGSFDEFFEVLTLMQTKKVTRFPVILMGKEFWNQMVHFQEMIEFGVIDESDMKVIHFAETAEEAWGIIKNHYQLSQ